MKYRNAVIGLSLFLVVAMATTWMVLVTLRRDVEGPTNEYSAMFTDVSGMHSGDDVRIAGVRVGRVDRVDLEGTLAKVTFQVQKDQVVYKDTIASVTYQNIIGQRYLGLSQEPSADRTPLASGAQIPLENTRPSFDISYVLNGFEPLFGLMDPQQVDNLTNAVIKALQGDSGSVLTLITQTSALAETLAGPDQVLDELVTGLNNVATNLAARDTDLDALISQTHDVMVTLDDRRDQLVASVGSINAAVTRLATITDNIYPPLHDLLEREPGFLANMVGPGRERWSFMGSNISPFFKGFARITEGGTYADAYLCDVNSTIFAFLSRLIPAVVRLASPGNVIQHTPMCR